MGLWVRWVTRETPETLVIQVKPDQRVQPEQQAQPEQPVQPEQQDTLVIRVIRVIQATLV